MRFKSSYKILALGCVLLLITACSSVTIDLKKPIQEPLGKPSFSDYRAFYFWGMLQTKHFSLNQACPNQIPLRIRSYASLEDVLVTTFTLGIYTSRTLDVWCTDSEPAPVSESESK